MKSLTVPPRRLIPLGVLTIGVVIGVVLVSQLRLRVVPERVSPLIPALALTQAADLLTASVIRERADVDQLQQQLATAQAAAPKTQADRALLDQVVSERDQLGLTPRNGRGITITIADASRAVGAFGVVGAADLRDVINVLWRHQATAISVNGERIVPTTAVVAAADLTIINGAKTTQPYTIDALGSSSRLLEALASDSLLQAFRAKVSFEGVRFGSRATDVTVPAYHGTFFVEHARSS